MSKLIPEIHTLAQFLAVRSKSDGVVILTSDHKAAIDRYPSNAQILLLHGKRRLFISDEGFKNLPSNVAPIRFRDLDKEILNNKIFVCVDYLETVRFYHQPIVRSSLKFLTQNSSMSISSVKEGRGWRMRKLKRFVSSRRSTLTGKFQNNLLALDGKLTNVYGDHYPLVNVLAIVSQYNEADIIEPVVKHLLSQGVDIHVIDNWSNDGSFEMVNKMAAKYSSRVSVERFPKKDSAKYEWKKILERVSEVAKERSDKYKWVISNDADEIRWSPWNNVSLQKAISFIDHLGFNIIDYTVFNFIPTKDGFKQGLDPLKFFDHGDFGHEGWHFMQLKTWGNTPEADIASSSGHLIKINNPKIYPLKFLLAHYSLRSNLQASKKVFQERKPRFINEEKDKGWHSHYDNIQRKTSFVRSPNGLIKVRKNKLPQQYLLQCLSGIGIKVEKVKK